MATEDASYPIWIRRDVDPTLTRDFHLLSKAEAKAFMRRIVDSADHRIGVLRNYIAAKSGFAISPICNLESLRVIAEILYREIRCVPMSARQRELAFNAPNVIHIPGQVFTEKQLSLCNDSTLSFATDSALYIATEFVSIEPALVWDIDSTRCDSRNQPALCLRKAKVNWGADKYNDTVFSREVTARSPLRPFIFPLGALGNLMNNYCRYGEGADNLMEWREHCIAQLQIYRQRHER